MQISMVDIKSKCITCNIEFPNFNYPNEKKKDYIVMSVKNVVWLMLKIKGV